MRKKHYDWWLLVLRPFLYYSGSVGSAFLAKQKGLERPRYVQQQWCRTVTTRSEEGAFSFSGIFSYTPKGPYERPANSLLCNCQCIINRTHVNQDFVYPVPKIQRSPHVDAAAAANRYLTSTISLFLTNRKSKNTAHHVRFRPKHTIFLVHFFCLTEFRAFTQEDFFF